MANSDLEEVELHLKQSLAAPLGMDQMKFSLSVNWSSKNPGHREAIRAALIEVAKLNISPDREFSSLLDLTNIPRLPEAALSISHCPDLGGFAFAPKSNLGIGFDIEINTRVTALIACRVLPNPLELDIRNQLDRPNQEWLAPIVWAAKEASIKCFGNSVTTETFHLGNVELFKIEEQTGGSFSFTAKSGHLESAGYVTQLGHRTYALAIQSATA